MRLLQGGTYLRFEARRLLEEIWCVSIYIYMYIYIKKRQGSINTALEEPFLVLFYLIPFCRVPSPQFF